MQVIREKDAQIQSMERTHKHEVEHVRKQSSRERIEEVYNMIGKVQVNMQTIAEMNQKAKADRVVLTIDSSSASSPSFAINSQRAKQQSSSDRQLSGAYAGPEVQARHPKNLNHPKSRQPASFSLAKQSHTY